MEEHIVTRFGMLFFLVCNNGSLFGLIFITQWRLDNQVIINLASNYYPQGNGMVESTNKNLIIVIKKLLQENPKDWHTQLKYALWTDRFRIKNALGTSPYLLIYRQEPMFPLYLKILVLKFMKGYAEDMDQ